MSKTCGRCHINKPLEEFDFSKSIQNIDNRSPNCKRCRRIIQNELKQRDPEGNRAAHRIYQKRKYDARGTLSHWEIVSEQVDKWLLFLKARDYVQATPTWRGLVQLKEFANNNHKETRKIKEWFARAETTMKGLGYAEDI